MITADLMTEIQRLDFRRGRTMQSVAEEVGASIEEVKVILIEMTALGELVSQTEHGPGVWIVRYHAPDTWANERAALKRMREAA